MLYKPEKLPHNFLCRIYADLVSSLAFRMSARAPSLSRATSIAPETMWYPSFSNFEGGSSFVANPPRNTPEDFKVISTSLQETPCQIPHGKKTSHLYTNCESTKLQDSYVSLTHIWPPVFSAIFEELIWGLESVRRLVFRANTCNVFHSISIVIEK